MHAGSRLALAARDGRGRTNGAEYASTRSHAPQPMPCQKRVSMGDPARPSAAR